VTYTNNWPYEPLTGNHPSPSTFPVDGVQRAVHDCRHRLLGWHYAAYHGKDPAPTPPEEDPLLGLVPTPSMKATQKYFWVVMALFLVQIVLGATPRTSRSRAARSIGFALADVSAVRAHAQLAHAVGGPVDRHRLARHRPVHRAGDLRARAEVPAAWASTCLFGLPADHRGRRLRRPVASR
jgi:hypothetical protein